MDNIIRNALESYLIRQPASTTSILTRDEPSTSRTNDIPSSSASNPNRKDKTEGRLSGLLSRIRKKHKTKETKVIKSRKLQVKWQRFNPIENKFEYVRVNNGGGTRFIEVSEDLSFKEVKNKAIALYFENSENLFGDKVEHTLFTFASSCGKDLDDHEKVTDYLTRKGLLISKTFFVLKSETFDEEEDDYLLPGVN